MVAALRIYNNAYCLEKFVCWFFVDISVTFRDVWEPVPYEMFVVLYNYSFIGKVWLPLRTRHAVSLRLKTNVSCIAVGDGILDVPKRHLHINLKFGLQFSPNKLTFPLDLPAEALGKLSFSLLKGITWKTNCYNFAFVIEFRYMDSLKQWWRICISWSGIMFMII